MLKILKIKVELRIVFMLYYLFDRGNEGYFTFEGLNDILEKNLIPNYKKIIREQREEWRQQFGEIPRRENRTEKKFN
jgi:hypothetical protein